MSERYVKEINDLREWFKQRLPALGKIKLTEAQWEAGTDSLEDAELPYHRDLVRYAFIERLTMRKYDLSYNQICVAFFGAAEECSLLEIVSNGKQANLPCNQTLRSDDER